MRYPIAIEAGTDQTAYGVVVPDLPGCFSAGDTLDEALANAEDAVLLWLEDMIANGKAPPKAATLEAIAASGEFKDWTLALVSVDMSKLSSKAVRINISVPDKALDAIDRWASSHGETRSGFLVRAALETMRAEAA